jgi:hypothetical protein
LPNRLEYPGTACRHLEIITGANAGSAPAPVVEPTQRASQKVNAKPDKTQGKVSLSENALNASFLFVTYPALVFEFAVLRERQLFSLVLVLVLGSVSEFVLALVLELELELLSLFALSLLSLTLFGWPSNSSNSVMIFSKQINFPRFWKNLFRMHPNRAAGMIFTFRNRLIDVLEGTCQLGLKLLGERFKLLAPAGSKCFTQSIFVSLMPPKSRPSFWFALPI